MYVNDAFMSNENQRTSGCILVQIIKSSEETEAPPSTR